MAKLLIAYTSTTGRQMSVAALDDPILLRAAAITAISEADEKAERATDPVTANLYRAEVSRLRTALNILIPGINATFSAIPN